MFAENVKNRMLKVQRDGQTAKWVLENVYIRVLEAMVQNKHSVRVPRQNNDDSLLYILKVAGFSVKAVGIYNVDISWPSEPLPSEPLPSALLPDLAPTTQ